MEFAMSYAGFWRRFAAWIIDAVILFVVGFIIGFIIAIVISPPTSINLLLGAVLNFIYTIVFWTWRGQTLGKIVVGVKIIKTDGMPIGIGSAILRYIGYIVSAIIIYIGYIMIAFNSKKQGLHDKIADTYVVRTNP
jgi:uncharacterized RDD family membrane protein YckC